MQKIINNLEISPIHEKKDPDSNNVFDFVITPFDLSTIEKEKIEQKVENLTIKKKNELKIPIASKKGHSRQISFNISSSQYIANETISNLDCSPYLKKNVSAMKIENLEDSLIKKNSSKHQKLSELISKNKNLELNVNFVINKIGKEKFAFLIECLDQSENPFEFIQNSEVAHKICGKDYAGVISMLKKIIINALSGVVK